MKTRTVLFVDDEIQILNVLKRLLRVEPYQAFFAESGQEALSILEKETIHVIVTDLGMPKMDGLTLLKQVQERYPDIIRLVISARDDRDSILNAINKGNVYGYIVKPWNNMELRLILRQAIDHFNLQQERRDLLKKLEEHNRLLEKRVEDRTKQLLAIEKQAEIGKHASHIVHNLNSPLHAIRGGLDLAHLELSDENPDLKEAVNYLHMIQSSTSDLEKIIAGILTHLRDKTLFKTEQIDINEIIKRELEFFKLNPIYKHQIEKKIDLSDNLPGIQGNPIHIKQIIDNLLKNAIDAMEHSQEKRLAVETCLEDKAVLIRISDTGEGIAEEDLPKIYSPHFTTKPIGKGTGLGLASVKAMVDAYSGDIQVESKKGKGTTLIVRIPIERPIFQD
ncbi:MAG: hybrid sensor histidine kinase/response regulator [Deltaproteobacteria bacterium]|nr:MAG: hybrid sensor histidine kinase/response regulator [Deltaproteobacteria bacterium]